ncbi:hypothetical protein OAE93_00255 [bacterium]|nr:hypothetical protein [bacterium]
MSWDEMSEMRWDKKKEIATKLELLQSDLEDYLEIWKKNWRRYYRSCNWQYDYQNTGKKSVF